jgi:hypothetical protein
MAEQERSHPVIADILHAAIEEAGETLNHPEAFDQLHELVVQREEARTQGELIFAAHEEHSKAQNREGVKKWRLDLKARADEGDETAIQKLAAMNASSSQRQHDYYQAHPEKRRERNQRYLQSLTPEERRTMERENKRRYRAKKKSNLAQPSPKE